MRRPKYPFLWFLCFAWILFIVTFETDLFKVLFKTEGAFYVGDALIIFFASIALLWAGFVFGKDIRYKAFAHLEKILLPIIATWVFGLPLVVIIGQWMYIVFSFHAFGR